MGAWTRAEQPNLSPVERPEVDDGSREELAAFYDEMTRCVACNAPLDDGDTVVRDHDGGYWHYDCYEDGGCEPPNLKPFDYQP